MRNAGIGSIVCALALSWGCATTAAPGPAAPEPPTEKAEPPPDVEKSALPFSVLVARGGREVEPEFFYDQLSMAQVVCIGEQHTDPHHHWAQLHLLHELSKRQQASGVEGALGMEMVQRPFQGVLDDYAAGKIDEETMRSRIGWKKRWGYDYALYGPMIRLAKKRGLALLALNTVKELTKKVSRKGLDALSDADRTRLPEIDLANASHRAWFFDLMTGMGGAGGHSSKKAKKEQSEAAKAEAAARSERIYSAQVVWDETMAETAADWLAGGDKRQVIILAGGGHCHDSAIIARLERRGADPVLSVQPVVDDGEASVAEHLAEPKNDYIFAMKPKAKPVAKPQPKAPAAKPPHPMPHPKPAVGGKKPPHPTPDTRPPHATPGTDRKLPHPLPPPDPKPGR